MSASYFLRPNAPTLKMLDKYRTLPIKESKNQINSIPNENNGQCIAMYVRRADKAKEMKLLPFSRFSDAAEMLWEAGYMNNSNAQTGSDNVTSQGTRGKPVIFIGTEDSSVLREAMLWGKKKGYQVRAEKITVRTPFHTYIHTHATIFECQCLHPLQSYSQYI